MSDERIAIIGGGNLGSAIARGLVAYSSADAERLLGHKSSEIHALLGFLGRDEMIHRDDLVLTS